MYKNILITGASSGIGKELALHFAQTGVTLILAGRDGNRLESVKSLCVQKGAEVLTKSIDVADQVEMDSWIAEIDALHPVDLVIANAGIRQDNPGREQVNSVLKANLDGVLNTIYPLMELMKIRRSGHLAVVSSLASFHAFANRGAYSASKAAVRIFCDAWRIELEPYNVHVSTICPGFIRTPLTDGHNHPMPFLMDGDKAANIIKGGLLKKKPLIAFPLPVFIAMRMLQCMPRFMADAIIRFLYKREKGN